MKLNKKGSTLLELVISISLIAVILVFLTRLLVDLNNTQTNSDYAKNNQLIRAEILRSIENDLNSNTLIGITDASTSDTLVINFTFNSKTSKISTTKDKFTYTSINGKTRTWTMDGGIIYPNKANLTYKKDSNNILYTLILDIEVHTSNDNNKYNNNNLLDDILITYMGKYKDFQTNITCLGNDC